MILFALADPVLLASASYVATQLGLSPLLAGDGVDALAIFEQQRPVMLVADSRLSSIGGVALVSRIRNLSGSLRVPTVVLLTQGVEEDTAGYDAGADNCLRASVEPVVLEAALRAALRQAAARRPADGMLRHAKAIADAIPDGMLTIDDEGNISWVNAALVRMFGYSAQELVGRNIGRLLAAASQPQNVHALRQVLNAAMAGLSGAAVEMYGRRKDDSLFSIELGLTEFVHDGVHGWAGVLRDTDIRRAAEAELAEKTAQLMRYIDEQESEARLAQDIMSRLLDRGGLADPRLRHAVWPAQRFSGDVIAAVRSPGGRLYVMLADATGHGLAAAISLLPALNIFYGMAARNLPLAMMVSEMNAKLRGTMPVGRFVAAALLCIDENHRSGEVWIGGTPDVLWLDGNGNVVERFASNRLPLGIADTSPLYANPGYFEWSEPGQLFACSDGLCEARSAAGEHFESERVMAALSGDAPGQRIAAVEMALRDHMVGVAAADDISLFTVDLA